MKRIVIVFDTWKFGIFTKVISDAGLDASDVTNGPGDEVMTMVVTTDDPEKLAQAINKAQLSSYAWRKAVCRKQH